MEDVTVTDPNYTPISRTTFAGIMNDLETHPDREYWTQLRRYALADRMRKAVANDPGEDPIYVKRGEWLGLASDLKAAGSISPPQYAALIGTILNPDGDTPPTE